MSRRTRWACRKPALTDYSIILDGEMLVWDPIVEKYLAFGTLKTAASGETRNTGSWVSC